MSLNTLRDLFVELLTQLHSEERHSLDVLPTLAVAACSPDLARAFQRHIEETRQHVVRLRRIADALSISLADRETQGMRGILVDCLDLAHDRTAEPHVRDAALIAVAQHMEHDEIAGYGCARTWAMLLDEMAASVSLQETLLEEKKFDSELTRLAARLNAEAACAPVLATV